MAVVQGVAPSETEAPLRTDGALTCGVGRHWLFDSLGDGWEEALGWTRDELTSRPFADFVHPADRSAVLAAVSGGDGGEETVLETRFRARGGTWRRIRWVPTPDPGDVAPAPVVRERVVTVPAGRTARPAASAPRLVASAIAMGCLVLLVAGVVYSLTRPNDPGASGILLVPAPSALNAPISGADMSSVTVPRDAIGAPLAPTKSVVSRANSPSERH